MECKEADMHVYNQVVWIKVFHVQFSVYIVILNIRYHPLQ